MTINWNCWTINLFYWKCPWINTLRQSTTKVPSENGWYCQSFIQRMSEAPLIDQREHTTSCCQQHAIFIVSVVNSRCFRHVCNLYYYGNGVSWFLLMTFGSAPLPNIMDSLCIKDEKLPMLTKILYFCILNKKHVPWSLGVHRPLERTRHIGETVHVVVSWFVALCALTGLTKGLGNSQNLTFYYVSGGGCMIGEF